MDNHQHLLSSEIYTENWKNPNFGLIDLDENINQWPDKDISEYYGIDSISSKVEEKSIDK